MKKLNNIFTAVFGIAIALLIIKIGLYYMINKVEPSMIELFIVVIGMIYIIEENLKSSINSDKSIKINEQVLINIEEVRVNQENIRKLRDEIREIIKEKNKIIAEKNKTIKDLISKI